MEEFKQPEIPNYKKKKNSNTSKSGKRSDHQHVYSKTAIVVNNYGFARVYKVCEVCGRCGDLIVGEFEGNRCVIHKEKDLKEKYPDLEVIYQK